MKNFILIFAAVLAAQVAQGSILLSDAFNYPDGPIVGAAGSPWTIQSGSAGDALVASGKLEVSFSRGDDVNALLFGQPYTTSSGAVLYFSFTVNFSALPTTAGTYFAGLKDTGLNYRARVWASTTGATSGYFRIGIGNASGASATTGQLPNDLSLNQNYFIVGSYSVATGSSVIWLNPVSETNGVNASDTASAISITSFAFRQSSGEGTTTIDDLKVGTSFADVTSSNSVIAPIITMQPQSQTVSEGANVNFNVVADGTVPLNFQWQFNGTNVTNATSSSLSLSNVTLANAGNYSVIVSNSAGSTNSQSAALVVNAATPQQAISVLTYNTKGNGATNWTTNAPQVQAIGRQMQYLQPDIITFQEIPLDLSSEMTNFVKAYLPGYFLARNSGSDGFIRSVIASRFPITRSSSWLVNVNLNQWGYTNTNSASSEEFTRDLFEAQINVAGFAQPLHVFTTHLKSSSGGYTDAAAKRAAEAAAITNFFATNFFVLYPNDPYFLSGDMNEANTNTLAIQRLISAPTGLRLTNPVNPFTGSINTFSIQDSLSSRIDYIFPGGIFFSNIISSQVFRTDLLNPVPPNLQTNDDKTASDHLPVMMVFKNPYDTNFRITSTVVSNQLLTVNWQSSSGRQYRVESSIAFTNWIPFSSNLTATGTNCSFTTNRTGNVNFLRIYRFP